MLPKPVKSRRRKTDDALAEKIAPALLPFLFPLGMFARNRATPLARRRRAATPAA